jgi:hypothetical protein
MPQRTVDTIVLLTFSILYRVAVTVLKWRKPAKA